MTVATEVEQGLPTLREAMQEHMVPVLAIIERLDGDEDVDGSLAGAIISLAMRCHDHLDRLDGDHGFRSDPEVHEWWEAQALCAGIAMMVMVAAGEVPSTKGRDIPDELEAFTSLQTYARMIRERWMAPAAG
jgi:hypothetical protein